MLSQLTTRDQRMRGLLTLLSGEKSQAVCAQSRNSWPLDLPLVQFRTREDIWTLAMLSRAF